MEFRCKHCGETLNVDVVAGGELPHGVLTLCTCSEARIEFETEHRKEMERRKRARKSIPLTQVGRTK